MSDADIIESPVTLSIVTVCFNAARFITRTLDSVISQKRKGVEFLVIDGGSHDGTIDILQNRRHEIDTLISESDKGIYDAMNKAIAMARGEWVLFLNAGDTFHDANVVDELVCTHLSRHDVDFLYSDVYLVSENGRASRSTCDHRRKIINHQCAVYRRKLHSEFGPYLVSKGVTISDYLFFCLIPDDRFDKISSVIANYDVTGVSQGQRSIDQKFTVDFLLNRIDKKRFVARLYLFGYYLKLRKIILRR